MHLSVEVGAPIDLGDGPFGHQRMVPIIGGTVTGQLSGAVVTAGADLQTLRSTEVTELDATYTVRTDTGATVLVRNVGLRRGSADDIGALLRGESVDPERIYFRAQPRLSTANAALWWLNESVFVATGVRTPTAVNLDVFAVR